MHPAVLPEILLIIVRHVASVSHDSLYALLFVSHQMRAIAEAFLYEDIKLGGRKQRDPVYLIAALHSALEASASGRNLGAYTRKLTISFQTHGYDQEILNSCISRLRAIFPHLTNLRYLRIGNSLGQLDPSILSFLPPSAHLTHFDLSEFWDESELTKFLHRQPSLQSLVLRHRFGPLALSPDSFPNIQSIWCSASNFHVFACGGQLVHAHISVDLHDSPQLLIPAVEGLQGIRTLSIDCPFLARLSSIIPHFPNLEYLKISSTSDAFNASHFNSFSSPRLRYLLADTLTGFETTREFFAQSLFEMFPQLTCIDLPPSGRLNTIFTSLLQRHRPDGSPPVKLVLPRVHSREDWWEVLENGSIPMNNVSQILDYYFSSPSVRR